MIQPHLNSRGLFFSLCLLTALGSWTAGATAQTVTVEEEPASSLSASTATIADLTAADDGSAIAFDLSAESDPMAQVTSVSQLSDVQPTDWAFPALQSLVERYGCIAGYPDGTYRGNRALTRYEFAAGLNACLDRILEIVSGGGDLDPADLSTVRRLQEEFAAELATLRGRVDSLEARTAELEANQFSTTTKLFGQVVMGVQGRNDTDYQFFVEQLRDESEVNLIANAQLSFYSQFSPRSLLVTGLQMGDGSTNGGGLSNFVSLGYEGDTDNDVVLSDLNYRQLVGDDLALIVGPKGVNAVNVFRGANRVEGAGFGPLSRFAQRNPIVSIGAGDGGLGVDWQIGDRLSLQGVYSTSDPTSTQNGLFGGENGVTNLGAQIIFTPIDRFNIGLQYINSYSPFGRLFTGVGDDQLATLNGTTFRAPIQTNAFGASAEWQVASRLTAGGWFGFTTSELLGESGNVETVNWMTYLNFPDLFGEGNLGGLYFGQPPRITSSDLPAGRNIPAFINSGDASAPAGDQPSTAYHLEAFYLYRVSDNIAITPGVIAVFNPNHNDSNDTVVIGAVRTTFTF